MHLPLALLSIALCITTASCIGQTPVWDIVSFSQAEINVNGKWSQWSAPRTGYTGSVVKFPKDKDLIIIEASTTKFMRIINQREVTFDSKYNPVFGFDCVDDEGERCLITIVHDSDQISHMTIQYPIIMFRYGLKPR